MSFPIRVVSVFLSVYCSFVVFGTDLQSQELAVTSDSDRPPNIVLIISDDQAWTDFGFMGHEAIETPSLDALANEATCFWRGYVPTALCRPSLATLITGRYPHQHGITGNDPVRGNDAKDSTAYKQRRARLISHLDNFDTLPRLLSERGYVSHQSGKWWEGSYLRGGFTHGMTRGFPNRGGRHGDDGLKIGREGMAPINDFIDDAVGNEKPFFVWYAPFLPHDPHNPPERLLQKYQSEERPEAVAKYFAMCEWFDETCGQLIKKIDDTGQRDNTLIVFVTDNGWIQSPVAKGGGGFEARSKQSPYEGGVRTPIMFRWPGRIPAGKRDELCSSIDIMPTVLAAAGARTPDDLPGLNLLSKISDGALIERDAIFGESFAHDVEDVVDPVASLNFRWIIEGRWKLLLTYDGTNGRNKFPADDLRPQLFDVVADPMETCNLAADHADLVQRLSDRIDQWWDAGQRRTTTEWSEQPVPVGR